MNSQSLKTDVFVEGSGVRRGARVTVAGVALLCDELMVPYGEVFWVSRRKGMLLLFAVRATLAIKGLAAARLRAAAHIRSLARAEPPGELIRITTALTLSSFSSLSMARTNGPETASPIESDSPSVMLPVTNTKAMRSPFASGLLLSPLSKLRN